MPVTNREFSWDLNHLHEFWEDYVKAYANKGYAYGGAVNVSSPITTSDKKMFYLLTEAGTYANMSSSIVHQSGIGIALWNGSAWSYQNVPSSAVVDLTINVNDTMEYTKKPSVMFNGTKFIAVSASYYTWYYKANYACQVELTFTRNDSYTHDGRICIVNNEADIVVDTTATQITQVSKNITYTNTFDLTPGQCLCVAARASDVMNVVMKKKPISAEVSELKQTSSSLVTDMSALKTIDETYPGLTIETGKVVYSTGGIATLSGNNACTNIPVIPNSRITLTLPTVTSGGGRGFAFYDQNGTYISGVAAVSGTLVYEMVVPANAIRLAITLWGSTNEFSIEVTTSSTNIHESIYKDLAPEIWGLEEYTSNATINSLIKELYIDRGIYETSVSGASPARRFELQFYGSCFHLYIYNSSTQEICHAVSNTIVPGQVLKVIIDRTTDTTSLPEGMTLGYVLASGIFGEIGKFRIIPINYVCALKNSPQIAAYIASQTNDFSPKNIQLCLPDNITAIVGDTLQVFYRGIIFSPLPDKYDILVRCAKGKQYPRYWEYTPVAADIGTQTFTIQVKDDNRAIIAEKSCTLTIKAKATSPSTNKNILCFGASTTTNGEWPHEADRRLTGSGGTPTADGLTNITFCGSKTKEGTGYFGVGGWNWSSYTTNNRKAYRFQVSGVNSLSTGATYTNNGNTFTIAEVNVTSGSGNILCSVSSLTPAPLSSGTLTKASGNGDATITYSSVAEDTSNPLWDSTNNKMSFIPYANSYCNGQIDIVYVWLGWNGSSAGQTDFTSMLADVKTFADTLHSEFPNAKLKIMGEALPSYRGGMGANYGASGYWADEYGMLLTSFNMSDAYQAFANQSDYSGFVEFVNMATQFDVDYNMQHTEKAVNTRNTSVTEWMDTNGVHPALPGYMQVADVVYRNIMKELQ